MSNTSYNKTKYHKPYRRYYPSDSTYLWWDWNPNSCEVTFWSDSLYVVGGSLSVDCIGALNEVPNIDNSFSVTTDTVINDTAQATKLIMVDEDPANSMFYDSLGTDIIRAIAWVEYAGSNDTRHCDGNYNPQWNDYWDHVIVGQDTCYETKFPCENRLSTATGTMQMIRTVWEPAFSRPDYMPTGYFQVSWDSLAWSWKINVFNGKFIYWTDNFHHINLPTNPQRNWDSLYTPESDYTPDIPNKEDISVYGYYAGATRMKKIKTTTMWKDSVMTMFYVVDVRRYKHTKPWSE